MATWVLGDVHGCYATLEALLEGLPIDWQRDRLWLVGDLVNRGPHSLEALRWARRTHERLGERFVTVLGNHDLHLLARDVGAAKAKRLDTLDDVLAARDRTELVEWLARRPLLHRDQRALVVHAGLLPAWTREEAEKLARSAEAHLQDRDARRRLLEQLRADPRVAGPAHTAAVLTRLRTLDRNDVPSSFSGAPDEAPGDERPWFERPGRWREPTPVLFGHWAALGLYRGDGVIGLDSGCVWGGALTALRLDDGRTIQQPACDGAVPERT